MSVPVPGVPFHERWGVILNEEGRIIDPDTEGPITGLYTAGWIKRGPTGIIGTNKPDAAETVASMMTELEDGLARSPGDPSTPAVPALLAARGVRYVNLAGWRKLDAAERAAGESQGRPRVKVTRVDDMLAIMEGNG